MRFSLKQLVGWTTAAAACCAVLFGIPSAIGATLLALGLVWLPIVLISGLVYARGWRRAFFLGATIGGTPVLLPLILYMFMAAGMLADFDAAEFSLEALEGAEAVAIKFALAGLHGYIAACGVVALVTRWLVSPPVANSTTEVPLVTADLPSATARAVSIGPPAPHVRIADAEVGIALATSES